MPFQDLIRYGVNTQGNRFGGAADAAAEGFRQGEERLNAIKDRAFIESERKRIADEREQQELDADYGKMFVPPTGKPTYDASVDAMAREWKAEYAANRAAKQAGKISNEEYVAKEHEIFNRAQQYKAGSEVLTNFASTYRKGLEEGQISESTPANIRMFADALMKGDVAVENIDGRPTVIGQLADGEPVQMDLAAIASGDSPLRFNQKVDSQGLVDSVAKVLEGYKTTVATENGLALGNVGWEQIQEKGAHEIEQLLNNQSTVEALAADELGYNHEEIKALGSEELQDRVGDYLLDKVQRDYYPVQKIDKFTSLTDYQAGTLGLQKARLNQGLNQQGQPNASLLKFQQTQEQQAQVANVYNNAIQSGDLRGLIGLGPIQNIKEPGYFGSKYTLETKGGKIKIDPKNPADAQILANLLGLGSLQQPSQGASADNAADPLGIN